MEQMKNTNIRCWIKTHKNEMEAGAENHIATGREMDSESC